ncbi:MAG: hypothetical protein RIC35_04305 [Marinoscillum sp.]
MSILRLPESIFTRPRATSKERGVKRLTIFQTSKVWGGVVNMRLPAGKAGFGFLDFDMRFESAAMAYAFWFFSFCYALLFFINA